MKKGMIPRVLSCQSNGGLANGAWAPMNKYLFKLARYTRFRIKSQVVRFALALKKLLHKSNEEELIVPNFCVFMCCHHMFLLKCFLLVIVLKTSFSFGKFNLLILSIMGESLRTALYSKNFV